MDSRARWLHTGVLQGRMTNLSRQMMLTTEDFFFFFLLFSLNNHPENYQGMSVSFVLCAGKLFLI